MTVIDHCSDSWFLLESSNEMYLDVNCNISAFEYNFLFKLNEEEILRYKSDGKKYIDILSEDVNDSGPAEAGSKSRYLSRKAPVDIEEIVYLTIVDWKKTKI